MKNIKKDTIIRTIILFIAFLNQCLAIFGKDAIPITDDQIYQGISIVFTMSSSIWAWWKNNSFTKNAIEADKYKDSLKNSK